MPIVKVFLCVKGCSKPNYSLSHDSHTALLKEVGIKDDKLFERGFVRVSIWPKENWFDPMVKFNGWDFEVGDAKTLPAWFEDDRHLWFDRCVNEVEAHILPLIKQGTFPGDLSINADTSMDFLKWIMGHLYVNRGAVFTANNLEVVGGKIALSPHSKLISPLKDL